MFVPPTFTHLQLLYCTKAPHTRTREHFPAVMPSNNSRIGGANLIIKNKTAKIKQQRVNRTTWWPLHLTPAPPQHHQPAPALAPFAIPTSNRTRPLCSQLATSNQPTHTNAVKGSTISKVQRLRPEARHDHVPLFLLFPHTRTILMFHRQRLLLVTRSLHSSSQEHTSTNDLYYTTKHFHPRTYTQHFTMDLFTCSSCTESELQRTLNVKKLRDTLPTLPCCA